MIETRTVNQVLIHKLIMNPMKECMENSHTVAWSDDKDKLIDFYNNESVERYADVSTPSFECPGYTWYKSFKRGGVLEWYNPITSFEQLNIYGQGIQQEWVDLAMLSTISIGLRIY